MKDSLNAQDDDKYFKDFVQGVEKGLGYFMKQWHNLIFRYASMIIHDDFEIDSFIQNAFIEAWGYREKINDTSHLLCFLKQHVKWACYAWRQKSKNHVTISMEFCEYHLTKIDEEIQQDDIQIQLDLLDQAISFLPKERAVIIILRKKGFSCSDIAKIQNTSYQYIARELKKGLTNLRWINDRLLKASLVAALRPRLLLSDYKVYLNKQQSQIFKLYYEEGYDLPEIAESLHLSLFQLSIKYKRIKYIINNKH